MRRWPPLAALFAVVLFAPSGRAQLADSAVLVGTVSDSTGAVIPGVGIRLTHLATGTAYAAQTNESGYYRTPPLRPGEYRIEAETPGFKRVSRTGVALSVGDTGQVDLVLEVGEVAETIEVSAAAPLLQTMEGSTSTSMTNQQILDLPLNGRDYLQLARISAGVAPPPRSEIANNQGVSVGGSQATQVNFMIDGVDNNNQSIASQGGQKEAVKPQIDAIAEFKIVTNAYSAEYGRSMGGVVMVTTKSGTNEFHGSGFEFLRNERMDARNFFVPATASKPPFKRNQYGFSIGGPIRKNKMFFFGDSEWTKIRESNTRVQTVPLPAQLGGDFSGVTTRIYDPLTYSAASGTREPFPNNRIPDARIDSVSRTVRNWWPAPNQPGTTRNFIFIPPVKSDINRWDARFDHNLDEKQNYYLRISGQQTNDNRVPTLPDSADGLFKQGNNQDITNAQLALVYNRIWRPNFVGTVRAGWNYINTFLNPDVPAGVNAQIGLNMRNGFDRTAPGGATFATTGFAGIGFGGFNQIGSQTRQLSADFTWTKGRHTIKFGHANFWLQSQILNFGFARGGFRFDGRFTEQPSPRGGGLPLGDFLLGAARDADNSNLRWMAIRAPWFQEYVQDDWRVTDRLTVNLGLRYELNLPWVDRLDRIANFDMDTDPNNPRLIVPGEVGSGRSSRAMVATDKNNFAPRFGFAYRLGEKTVLRGGYGIFYANIMNTGGGEFMEINPPFHLQVLLTTDRITPSILLRDGLIEGSLNPRNAPPLILSNFERRPSWPIAQQWNFNIQRQLPGNMLWEIGYVGTKGDHIVRNYNRNYALPGPGNINARRRFTSTQYPGEDIRIPLARTHSFSNDAISRYHALQTKLEKRFGSGFSYLASYAFSRSTGDYTFIPGEDRAFGTDWGVQNPLDLRAERGLLGQHVKHRFVASGMYELPFGRGKKWGSSLGGVADFLLGGWTAGGIMSILTGFPMNLSVNGNPSNTGDLDRPNVVGEWRLPKEERSPERWFNTAAFVPNALFTFGNAGRNILLSPGTFKVDLAVHKNFAVSERVRAQFRAESFNAFNHPIFDGPNLQVGNPNIGIISNAAPGRIMQMGLKITF